MPEIGRLANLIEEMWAYCHHVSAIFPEDTDETVTVTAGDADHKWSDWAELVDNTPVALSTKFADDPGYIVSVLVEECNTKDVRYLLELAYGDDYTVIGRSRFMKAEQKANVGHQTRIRSIEIPAGETIYYRLKCETASKTAEIQVRYYLV